MFKSERNPFPRNAEYKEMVLGAPYEICIERARYVTDFAMGGMEVQFNVVDNATLRDAQAHPEKYRDLVVRVSGYSAYFTDLGKAIQDEIIARTAFEGF